jgi:hypothetical protein
MTHNQYVHNMILKMDAERAALKANNPARTAPRRNNTRIVAAAPTPTKEDPALVSCHYPGDNEMKALSIKQPYAGLIISGIKNIENRSWSTKYTGQLVIVSTAKPDAATWWEPMRKKCAALGVNFPDALCKVNGAALGVVDFNHLVWTREDGNAETDLPTLTEAQVKDWWNPDMIGFILEHPRRLMHPIPVTGRLGLYNLAVEVMAQIVKQL